MKVIFARLVHNGPQYTSQEFREFAQDWNFLHVTTTPYHPQANGLAERTVQTVKNFLTKPHTKGRDPSISILKYRNMPVDQIGYPARLPMSRRSCSVIPLMKSLLQPKVIDNDLASSKIVSKSPSKTLL